ncbi:MAG TPA: S-adenosylmethionine:tRNA ribosyltransferase-isomerase, partial [Chitinophagaceae bacterium]|nr:S-adenosylmethionine:tRNA ribosyltransferase-isomerase [Chitinophagaceae bacterium]
MSVPAIETASYQYELSQDRIATHPVQPRDHSRLLVYENGRITDSVFTDLSSFLPAGSLIVFNNSKVIPARLWFRKPEGGLIELFLLEPMKGSMAEVLSTTAPVEMLCMVGGFKKWKGREILQWPLHEEHHLMARLVQKEEEGFVIRFEWDDTGLTFSDVLEQAGKIPIPPYLLRESEACDSTDYQTIYAREK